MLLAACGVSALAADAPPVATPLPYSGPPVTAVKPAPPDAVVLPTNYISATLNDGSKVEFDADGSVLVVAPDGTKTPAPDGTMTLKDGTPFTVKDGKRVSEY